MYLRFFVLVFATMVYQPLFAQFHASNNHEIKVYRDGVELANPWAGGINAAQISTIDVNQDGLDDLFVFDRSGNKPMVFLNNGSSDPNSFEYSYEYSNGFPSDLRNWALLRDFNCDGKKDIFTYNGIGGFRIFKNVSEGADLQFELIEENLKSHYNFLTSSYFSNIFISSVDIPAVDDVDGDGDLDILVYSVSGVLVEYHKNYSVEETGTCDTLLFSLANRCYGFFSESAFDNTITLHDEALHNVMCPTGYNVVDPHPMIERPGDLPFIPTNGNARHSGTTILTIEMTGSLPKEIVLGDIGHHQLTALTNSVSSEGMDTIIAYDTHFPSNHSNTEAVSLQSFPGTFYEDVDQDGVRDLLVSPNNEWASENHNSVWYYRNTGADDQPVFELQQKDLFQRGMIEVGEGCTAFFLDYNQDGLTDLIVGNKGYFVSTGVYDSRLMLFENTGTPTQPEFTFVTDDFANLSNYNLGQALHPTFADLDNDGDIDMLVGTSSGRVYRFNNIAGAGNEVSFVPATDPILKDGDGNEIDPGQFSTPQLIDLNGDGLTDLVMGERNGRIHYYQNSGTTNIPVFQPENDFLGGVQTTEGFSPTGYSVIQFFEMDSQKLLITGTESGKLRLYSYTDLNGDFILEEDQLLGIKNGIRSTVGIYDIDNDGYPDLFTGNFSGGLLFFKGAPHTSSASPPPTPEFIQLFPNPTSGQFSVATLVPGTITIYNMLGKRVSADQHINGKSHLAVNHLPKGIYLVVFTSTSNQRSVRKLVVE